MIADMDVSKADYRHACAWDLDLPPLTLPEMFLASAERTPDAPAVDFMGRRFTYRELADAARSFAAGLQAAGFAKGDRIGLFLPNVPMYVAAYYGALLAGAVVVNFSPLYTADELCQQVEDSGARALVTLNVPALLPTALDVLDRSSLETLVVGHLADALPKAKGLALRLLGRNKLSPLPKRADVLRWSDMLGAGAPQPVALDAVQDIALLQYTGGTTGVPKGAMLTHQNLSANARQVNAIDPWKHDADDVILGVLPLFHVFANTCVLNRTMLKGGCIAMLPRFDAKDALKTLARVKATALPGVPTMYQALLDHPDFASTDFSSLKICISGGAPLNAVLKAKFEAGSGARLVEGYGLTESSGVVSTNPYEAGDMAGTIGQVLPRTEVRLLDKEDPSRAAPEGEPGELAVRGPQIMRGYWNRPDADAKVMQDGWLRTGDVAQWEEHGFLRIVDRIKDMIAVGGFKVFPSEVEKAVQPHPAVKEVLVIGVPDDYLGERPQAFVTLNDEAHDVTGDMLRDWANGRLGKHERLAGVTIRQELPKTMIGKLDRKTLREQELRG